MKSSLSSQLQSLSFMFFILLIMMFFSFCSKDTVPEKIHCPTSIGWGGQTYQTIEIGNQCWFRENINIGKFVYGSKDQTNNDTIEKYCWYDQITSCDGYGGLYQWDEMMQYVKEEGAQGICPVGWHIPNSSDMFVLQEYLGGHGESGGKMKEQGNNHWCSPNIGATNSSGFTALPGGERDTSGYFSYRCSYAFFWASTESDRTKSEGYSGLLWNEGSFYQIRWCGDDKKNGFSVRCIMNSNQQKP